MFISLVNSVQQESIKKKEKKREPPGLVAFIHPAATQLRIFSKFFFLHFKLNAW